MSSKTLIFCIAFAALFPALTQAQPCPHGGPVAFPGAEGFGRCSKGGRGGRVIEVTSLAEDGAGTLRACLEATGARTWARASRWHASTRAAPSRTTWHRWRPARRMPIWAA